MGALPALNPTAKPSKEELVFKRENFHIERRRDLKLFFFRQTGKIPEMVVGGHV
jgi:hypothetical protein